VQELLLHLDPTARDQLQHDAAALIALVRSRMLQLSLLQEAKDKKWDQTPDVAFRAEQAHDAVIVDSYVASLSAPDPSYPTDADIQAAYDTNKQRFVIPRTYHLPQIFLRVPNDAGSDAVQKTHQGIRQDASKPRADFAAIARAQSHDNATAGKGGEIGWIREDQLAPAIKNAVAGLPEGGLSDLVRMPDGWHLVNLLGTHPATTAPLSDVRDQIRNALLQQRTQQSARALLAERQQKQSIQINEIELTRMLTQ
jgi:peptidylprolyl isomerase